jgi:hypothetical protein
MFKLIVQQFNGVDENGETILESSFFNESYAMDYLEISGLSAICETQYYDNVCACSIHAPIVYRMNVYIETQDKTIVLFGLSEEQINCTYSEWLTNNNMIDECADYSDEFTLHAIVRPLIDVGDFVKFKNPTIDETEDRFIVLELRGNKALVSDRNHKGPIVPTFVYLLADLMKG